MQRFGSPTVVFFCCGVNVRRRMTKMHSSKYLREKLEWNGKKNKFVRINHGFEWDVSQTNNRHISNANNIERMEYRDGFDLKYCDTSNKL